MVNHKNQPTLDDLIQQWVIDSYPYLECRSTKTDGNGLLPPSSEFIIIVHESIAETRSDLGSKYWILSIGHYRTGEWEIWNRWKDRWGQSIQINSFGERQPVISNPAFPDFFDIIRTKIDESLQKMYLNNDVLTNPTQEGLMRKRP